MTRLLEKASRQKDSDRESLRELQGTHDPGLDGPAERAEEAEMMADAINQVTKKGEGMSAACGQENHRRDYENNGSLLQHII